MDLNFLIKLLEMSINAYHKEDLSTVIYKYGYAGNGVRCKLFHYKNSLVLAIKGTSLNILGYELGETSSNDKEMVNIMFNKCKKKNKEECEYFKKVEFDKLGYLKDLQNIITFIKYLYPSKEIILTGHSLGGALASLLSLIYNYQCITFSTPGEFYISKILQINRNQNSKDLINRNQNIGDSINRNLNSGDSINRNQNIKDLINRNQNIGDSINRNQNSEDSINRDSINRNQNSGDSINRNQNSRDLRIIHYGMCNDTIFSGKCDQLCNLLGYSVNTVKHNGEVYCLKISNNIKSVIFHNSSVLLSYLNEMSNVL